MHNFTTLRRLWTGSFFRSAAIVFLSAGLTAGLVTGCGEESDATGEPGEPGEAAAGDTSAPKWDSSIINRTDPGPLATDTVPKATPEGKPARYGLKSGHIRYRYGGGKIGYVERWFTDFGLYERRVDSSGPATPTTMAPHVNEINLFTPEFVGELDFLSGYGYRMPNPIGEYMRSDSAKTMTYAEYVMAKSGAENVGDTTILGYEAKIYRFRTQFVIDTWYMWRGILLRQHVYAPDENVEFWLDPVAVEPNVAVDEHLFKFPPGYKIDNRLAPPIPSVGAAPSRR